MGRGYYVRLEKDGRNIFLPYGKDWWCKHNLKNINAQGSPPEEAIQGKKKTENRKPKAKLFFLLILNAALLLSGCTFGSNAYKEGVSTHGALCVDGEKLVDASGEPFQLRGFSTHGIGWFGEYVNMDAMLSIKNAGGNVFRVAMYTEANSGYLEDREKNVSLVYSAIELAKELDMYVIVDWHILDDGNPLTHQDEAIEFFTEVTSHYPNDPAVIYEICNEPNAVEWQDVLTYGRSVCEVIRKNSPNALIILGTTEYSSNLMDAVKEPLEDKNLMYAFHYYAGQHDNFDIMMSAIRKKLPVFVSEWGVNNGEDGQPALEAAEDFVIYLNSHGISWCAWSLCNKDEVFSAIKPECEKLGLWEDEDLTDVGKLFFKNLKRKK